jgi:hypothetical protein
MAFFYALKNPLKTVLGPDESADSEYWDAERKR